MSGWIHLESELLKVCILFALDRQHNKAQPPQTANYLKEGKSEGHKYPITKKIHRSEVQEDNSKQIIHAQKSSFVVHYTRYYSCYYH